MKRLKLVTSLIIGFVVCSSLGLSLLFSLPESSVATSSDFLLRNITIVNPALSKEMVPYLSVSNNQLVIGRTPHRKEFDQVQTGDKYDGMYVLPGLINMHSHSPSKNLLNLSPIFSLAAVMHGVTTWRDAIDADGTGVSALREQIAEGTWPTPYVVSCAIITRGKTRWPNSNVIEHAKEVPLLVKGLKESGYDCIKSYENLNIDMIAQIKKSAKKYDMQVIGHVPEGFSIEQAWLPDTQHFFGVQTAHQHGVVNRNGNWESVDDIRLDQVAKHIVQRGMINTPTLVTLRQLSEYEDYELSIKNELYKYIPSFYAKTVWHPQKGLPVYRDLDAEMLSRAADALSKKQKLLKKLHDQGATLNVGTDTQQPFVIPGISMWQEMRLFEQAGISAEDVWAHATWKSQGQLPGKKEGRLADGSEATFLIFSKDPTLTLKNLDSLKAVVLRGNLYEIEELKQVMTQLQSHYESWPVSFISQFFVEREMERIARKFTH